MPSDPLDLDDIPANPNHPQPSSSPSKSKHIPLTRLLSITSFSHRRGPLRPPPTPGLLFDIRSLPNAPKRTREMYVGTDKPMRAAFMADATCKERVEGISRAIRIALEQATAEPPIEDPREKRKEERMDVDQDEEEEEEEEDSEDDDVSEEEDEEEESPDVHIRVGVCCEVGRHRSVACVEELARMEWPEGWKIDVVHRDLARRRSEKDKEKRSRKVDKADISD
ncbi:hypothetical protein H0H92_004118 [Tricholoma furcatifolium]|nr:hypothetical protein H0H92_004118 [Tricholoma furcatifolium]